MKKLTLALMLACAMIASRTAMAGDGHFETRYQTVLICGGHYEQVYIGEVYVMQYVPPRYERRLVQVWIPERRGGGTFDLKLNWNWHTW